MLIFSLISSCYFVNLIGEYPEIGIEVRYEAGQYVISDMSKYSWAEKRDFQIGDVIERIDNRPPEEHFTVRLYHAIEQAKTITLNRNGEWKTFHIQYSPYSKQLFYHLIIPIGFYIICIFMALYLLIFVPEMNRSTNSLLYFLIALGSSFISITATQRKDIFAFIIASTSMIGSITFFLQFMKFYFSNNQIKFLTKKQLNVVYVLATLLIIVSMFIYGKHNQVMNLYTIALSMILFLVTVYSLIQFYLKSKKSNHSGFLKVMIISCFVSVLPFVCLYVIPNIFYGEELISSEITGIFFLFFPVNVFYLVIEGKLFDFKFIIKRLPYYIILALGINIFLVLFGIVIFEDVDQHVGNWIKFNIGCFIICVCFLYIKDYMDFKLRNSLYHHQKNYQRSLYRFLHQAKNEYKFSNLIYSLRREIADVLQCEETCCIEINKRDNFIQVLESEYVPQKVLELIGTYQLDSYRVGSIIKIEGHYGFVLSNSVEHMIILVCKHNEKMVLNVDEMVWIETLCNYTNLLVECSNQVESLLQQLQAIHDVEKPPTWLAKLMFKLAEKERANLASDIHDGVLQDQIRLVRKLDTYDDQINDDGMKQIILKIKEELLDHIYMIRETCNHLRPPFLYEVGLKQALIDLFKKINVKATFLFHYDLPEYLVASSTEHEQAIYRIIQELLNNAMKHSKASNVIIKVFQKYDHIYITYVDNGIGMEMNQVDYTYHTLGLSGIITRIQSLNGEISIESKPEVGLQVRIKL